MATKAIALLLACAACALSGIAWADAADDEPFVDKATGLVFPARIEPYKRVSVTNYPDPRLGVKIQYSGPGRAEAFVYDLGLADIPTGVDSSAVEGAFEQSMAGLAKLLTTAPAAGGKKVLESTPEVKVEGRVAKLRLGVFTWELVTPQGLKPMTSTAIVTGFKGKFVKLLFTHPGDVGAAQEHLKALIVGFLEANPAERGKFLLEAKP